MKLNFINYCNNLTTIAIVSRNKCVQKMANCYLCNNTYNLERLQAFQFEIKFKTSKIPPFFKFMMRLISFQMLP